VDPLEGNIFDPQSLNRYAYSRNNPIVYLDPDGRSFKTGLQGGATPLTYMYNHPVETAGFALVAGATALVAPIAVAVVGVGLSAYATGNALSNAYNAPDTDTRDYYLGQATTFGALTALGVKGAGEVGGVRPGGKVNLPSSVEAPEGFLFGQESISKTFSSGDKVPTYLRGRLISDVAQDLKNGKLSSDQLPINYVIKGGEKVVENNRTLATFQLAGKNPSISLDRTGVGAFEKSVARHLRGSTPSTITKIRGVK
jgi:hypothetical protein